MSLKFRWKPGRPIDPQSLRCSFCGKSEHDIRKLIAGPRVFICDECVSVCDDILASGAARSISSSAAVEPPAPSMPSDPVRYLSCAICRLPTSWDEAVLVPERGALCQGCVGEIEAAIARKRGQSG